MQQAQVTRLGALLAVVLLVGMSLALLLPVESRGDECGRWFDRTWSSEDTDRIVGEAGMLGAGRQAAVQRRLDDCDSKLDNRRALTIGLGVATLVVPAGIWWVVGSGRRETTDA